MIKKKWSRGTLLFTVIFVSLAATGITYARWSGGLNVGLGFSTGAMDLRYSYDFPCCVGLVDEEGNELVKKQEADAVILDQGKTMELTAVLPFQTAEFLKNPDSLIKLEFPIEAGADGTVNRVELSKPDFRQEPPETLVMKPVGMALLGEDGQEEYGIPNEAAKSFGDPLEFGVFRETSEQNGTATGVIYLRMKEESRAVVASFPSKIEIEEPGADNSDFSGQLMITYSFSVPIYVEQGHDDVAILEEGVKQ